MAKKGSLNPKVIQELPEIVDFQNPLELLNIVEDSIFPNCVKHLNPVG